MAVKVAELKAVEDKIAGLNQQLADATAKKEKLENDADDFADVKDKYKSFFIK